MYGGAVHKLTEVEEGSWEKEELTRVPYQPSGTGWLPNGKMLVVSMADRILYQWDRASGLVEHANLFAKASFHLNDMVVDSSTGRAYVGNFGFDIFTPFFSVALSPTLPLPSLRVALLGWLNYLPKKIHRWLLPGAEIICVEPDGSSKVVADDMSFPNGSAITADGSTLIVAETFGARLTAFTIDRQTGNLSERRVWAELPAGGSPDGICLDEGNGCWVASPTSKEVIRLTEGATKDGKGATHRIPTQQMCLACMLGGKDGKTLFICTAPSTKKPVCEAERKGRIEVFCDAPYARSGWP
jgi:sugar lactone lactonase YvrE